GALHDRVLNVAVGEHACTRTELAFTDPAERADAHAVAQHHAAFEHHVDVDFHVASHHHLAADIHARGVGEARACGAQGPHQALLHGTFELGQLPGIVCALGLHRIVHQ